MAVSAGGALLPSIAGLLGLRLQKPIERLFHRSADKPAQVLFQVSEVDSHNFA